MLDKHCLVQTANTPAHFEYLVIKLSVEHGFNINEIEELLIERVNGFYCFPPNCHDRDYSIDDNEFDRHSALYDQALEYLRLYYMPYTVEQRGTALYLVHTDVVSTCVVPALG